MGSDLKSGWTGPTLDEIEHASQLLDDQIIRTPTVPLKSSRIISHLPKGADVFIKLELLQQAGSFKARGALLSIMALSDAERDRGVVTASAGNHALALSWAARMSGVAATVVMPESADPVRVDECKRLGATLAFADNIHGVFSLMNELAETRGYLTVHPFEGRWMTTGAATCGLELIRQATELDVVVVPIGGGGLISGIASAVKRVSPSCRVIGVEPTGADGLHRSFEAGKPVPLEHVETIADSLGAPVSMPISFGVARAHVEKIVCVTDDQMRQGMAMLYDAMKLAAEPACAASLAAICGPLRTEFEGKRVGIIACGSNISESRLATLVSEGRDLLRERSPDL